MRRTILIALAVAGALATGGCAARGAASETAAPAAAHQHDASPPSAGGDRHGLATQLSSARLDTAM